MTFWVVGTNSSRRVFAAFEVDENRTMTGMGYDPLNIRNEIEWWIDGRYEKAFIIHAIDNVHSKALVEVTGDPWTLFPSEGRQQWE